MKQTLTKIILGCIGLALLGYVAWLWTQSGVVTINASYHLGGLILAGGVGLYLLMLIAQPQFAPSSKWTLMVLGIALVIIAHLLYQDTASQHLYLRDIMKLMGVLFLIGGPTGLFHDEKVIEARKMEEAEIIEV